MNRGRSVPLIVVVMWAMCEAVALANDLATGEDAFNRHCAPCHITERQKAYVWLGPHLRGIFNAPAGRKEGYEYSGAFQKFAPGVLWNEDNLDAWIRHAQGLVPNSRMLVRIPDAEQRRIIIDYLRTYD